MTTINKTVNHGIQPNYKGYGLALDITSTGAINGTAYAIYAGMTTANANVLNQGHIHATDIGIDLTNFGTVTNTGFIYGGAAAVALEFSGSLNNSGTISGGAVNYGGANVAVYTALNITAVNINQIQNSGLITGKDIGLEAGNANLSNTGRIYGALSGVALSHGSIHNSGTISGKTLGLTMNGGTLDNAGLIASATIGLLAEAGTILSEAGAVITGNILGVGLAPTAATNLTFTNDGLITGGTAGVYLTASSLINFGVIDQADIGVYLAESSLTNAGIITGNSVGLYLQSGYASNTGTITSNTVGAYVYTGELVNRTAITGGQTGITLQNGAMLINDGAVTGGNTGVYVGSDLINTSGAISGGQFAVYGKSSFALGLNAGATFTGAIKDASGNGTLDFFSSTPATLAGIGTTITGFSNLNFLPPGFGQGGSWTVEGNLAGLATGQKVTSIAAGDTIVITDFAASSGTYISGGILLSNGATTHSINVSTYFSAPFSIPGVYAENGETYLIQSQPGQIGSFTPIAGKVSLITGSPSISVTPGEGNYASTLTIANTATLNAALAATVIVPRNIKDARLVNFGQIDSNANNDAVYSSFLNLTNLGTINGAVSVGVLANQAVIIGAVGARTLMNTGSIIGGAGGVTVTNSGLIANQASLGVALYANQGNLGAFSTVTGAQYGLIQNGYGYDTIQNAGVIEGGFTGVYIKSRAFNDAPVFANSGTIIGGQNGVLLELGGTIFNSGIISGAGYAINSIGRVGEGGPLHLTAAPGARFIGAVHAAYNYGHLTLAAGAGSLDIGASFTGFPTIAFAPGATWTLEGAISDLASGQSLTGLTPGDTLILDNFAATTEATSANGIILSNPTASATLNLNPLIPGASFALTTEGANTTLTAQIATLAGASTTTLTPGVHGYAPSFTIAPTGTLNLPGATAVYGSPAIPNATLVNQGAIFGDVDFFGPAHLQNAGVIHPAFAIAAQAGGTFENTGAIAGQFGFILEDGGNITNSGTLDATYSAILNYAGQLDLFVTPGATFTGQVADLTGHGNLILDGASPGFLDIGNSFLGFADIHFATSFTLEGSTVALARGQTITNFSTGDTLILSGFTATSDSFVSGRGLILSNGATSETLNLAGSLATPDFTVTATPAGTEITTSVTCFCPGTRIATPQGNIPIEHLKIGDLVSTHLGPQPIQWLGSSTYNPKFLSKHLYPIKIRRHAIAHNIPSRDLYVSPDHAICEAGILIHAHLLTNAISITQLDALSDPLTYIHLELPRHAIIFANNTPTESFIDEQSRHRFQNAHTAPYTPPQSPCLPRIFSGFHAANIQSRLAQRAGVKTPTELGALRGHIDESTPTLLRGWAQHTAAPNHPVTLLVTTQTQTFKVIANTYREDLHNAGLGNGRHAFSIPLPNLPTPPTLHRTEDHAPLHQNHHSRISILPKTRQRISILE